MASLNSMVNGGGTGSSFSNNSSLLLNVILWVVGFAFVFLVFRFVKNLVSGSPLSSAMDSQSSEISKHSSDRMANGNTYLEASVWLYDELRRSAFNIFKDVDEIRVGNFMLTVRKDEFKQLEFTYSLVSKEKQSFWTLWYSSDRSLVGDLKSAFNSSEVSRYLGHLGVL